MNGHFVLTVRDAIRDAIAEEMRNDELVILMGEDVGEYEGSYKVTRGILAEFGPHRVIDTPISEMGFAGMGIGAAMTGLRPIVEYMTMNFAMQAIDQIINSAAKTLYMSGGKVCCPIVFRGPNGAAARVGAQHSQCFASWYSHIPGLVVIAPYDSASAKFLLKEAIRSPDPVVFLEHELLYGSEFEVNEDAKSQYAIGRSACLRQGTDITLVSFSRGVGLCLEVAEACKEYSCEVIDIRTLRPLDIGGILRSLSKTKRLIVVEEGWPYAGIAAEIISQIMEKGWDYLDAAPGRVCAVDAPLPYAANLEFASLPSVKKVIDKIKLVMDQ